MSGPSSHEFGGGALTARVLAQGAELGALCGSSGRDYLWPAGPAWPRHAPNLFPIVGRLPDDTLLHDGKKYPLTQHGFARDMRFAWRDRTATGCTLALSDSEATRARYPFGFSFTLHYTIAGATLTVLFTVENTGEETLPVSMGAHPAFRWPLIASVPKDAYSLTFATDEPGPLRSVSGGLLTPHFRPTPIIGRTLALTEALFDADALILPEPKSRSVRFAAETGPALTVSWDGFPQLGIWSRAGGDFLCIEPWLGMATPVGFCGEFSQKPWLTLIPRGQSRSASLSITVEE